MHYLVIQHLKIIKKFRIFFWIKNLTWVKEGYAFLIMRCVALRCVALRCVALRNHFVFKLSHQKKRDILGKGARKTSFCEMFRFAQHDK